MEKKSQYASNLKPCPHNDACLCVMDNPCEGCDTRAESEEGVGNERQD
ncbi:MAG: hypothetical protein UX91_C0015G0015 [Candidatus Amesbacteria bacterium GW2011_GWB1_47_19]|nr:MAG: hypothetical protein UX91_C0015G0015 [Candidatus Amesbacteria bacterium GW2011_GWB1_47_19]